MCELLAEETNGRRAVAAIDENTAVNVPRVECSAIGAQAPLVAAATRDVRQHVRRQNARRMPLVVGDGDHVGRNQLETGLAVGFAHGASL
jgi:hypothetical protein